MRLAERLYSLPPNKRLGCIENLIRLARSGNSPKLRQVLTMPALLFPDIQFRNLFWRRQPIVYVTIAQAADNYCKRFWKRNIIFVLKNVEYEPRTGEVI